MKQEGVKGFYDGNESQPGRDQGLNHVRKARSASQRHACQEGQKTRLSIVSFNTSVFVATGAPTRDFEKAVAVFGT
jgi:hypothetical protein